MSRPNSPPAGGGAADVNTVVVNKTQNQIPQFSGAPPLSLSAEAWVRIVDHMAAGSAWEDEHTAGNALMRLTGPAATWATSLQDWPPEGKQSLQSWTALKPAFLARFGTLSQPLTDVKALLALQQKPNESVSTLADRVISTVAAVFRNIAPTNKSKKEGYDVAVQYAMAFHLMMAMNPTLRALLIRQLDVKDYHDLAKVKELAKKLESSITESNEQTNTTQTATITHDVNAVFNYRGGRGGGGGRGGRGRGRGNYPNTYQPTSNSPPTDQSQSPQRTTNAQIPLHQRPNYKRWKTTPYQHRPWIKCHRCKQWGTHFDDECRRRDNEIAALQPADKNPPKGDPFDPMLHSWPNLQQTQSPPNPN